ncbi:MAG: transporter [Ahrensia sp.]|nr:transporter [Ahrensia sp.]
MTYGRLGSLIAVVCLLAIGQILFKLAAGRLGAPSFSWQFAERLLFNPYLIAGIALYGVTTILWVLLLSGGNLSTTYPFVALTMVFVPLAGVLLFREPLSPGLMLGTLCIVLGLGIISFS